MAYNPEKIQEYAKVIFDRLNQFNEFTLATIARRIKNTGKLSAYDQQSLKNMADISGDMKVITKKLAEITKLNIDDLENVYSQTVSDGVNTYKPLYDFKNMPFVPFEQNDFAQQLVRHWAMQTAGEMINLSRTKALCFDRYNINGEVIGSTPLQGAFQEAIDSAVTAVSSGTADFNAAMSKTIENLGGSGVRVNYASGVTRSLSAMIRQNLLYAVKQSAKSYDEYVGEQLDCDGFEVDAHPGCRPTHEVIQGQIFASGDDDITIDGITYLSANKDLGGGKSALELLDDYGCLHFTLSTILGVSVPRYSKEQLAEIDRQTKELIEYDGRKKTLYEWKQTARRMERAIRKKQTQANMFKEAGNNTKAKDFRDEATAYRIKYNDMCENVGLRPQLDRMQTYKNKPLTNGDNGGIIKEQNKKNITIISDKAIENIQKVNIAGYTDEQCTVIQQQHKELLKYAKDNNNNNEVAFVFRKDLTDRAEFIGSDESLDFGSGLFGKGKDLFVMHNHPRNSSFSDRDIMFLLQNDSVHTLTIVKNNGLVETLSKTIAYDKRTAITELSRQYKKHIKVGNEDEISKAINKFLNKYTEGLEWINTQ